MNRQNNSTSEWEYHRGTWTERRTPWGDTDFTDFDDMMDEYGYQLWRRSDGEVCNFELWTHNGSNSEHTFEQLNGYPTYYVEVDDPMGHCQFIGVRDFPSLVQLLNELRQAGYPVGQLDQTS